ncbi:MAG: ribosome biogenesis GTPase Der [Lachnospiraceae bacterium]|jgi:GTP-binding protein|nr:ribosome biogenesis GTPase Der [Lachnospiraceae bacterium]
MGRKSKPVVAIVGRPNVGKSTLFNMLAGRKISIVEDTPGVTRDRIYADCTWLNYEFTLIDTGGIEPRTRDVILAQMREQAQIAIDMADVILFMVDGRQGMQDADSQVADMLRRSRKPVVLVVNKIDSYHKQQSDIYEFYNLGIGEPFGISSVNQTGIGDLLDEVVKHFPAPTEQPEDDDSTSIAVVGKPNVGKSSIVNRLIGENRVIVSEIAGTTRDAVDTEVMHDGRKYTFIDTAGLRRRSKVKEDLEYYMLLRTIGAVERADITILVIDASEGVSEQDAKIAGIAHDRGKAVIIAVNKWDLVEKDDHSTDRFTEKVRSTLSFLPYAEIIFISAQTGQRLVKLYDLIDMVSANQNMRIQTGVLNEIISEAVTIQQPPADKGKMLKIYYSTQTGVKPPTFVMFVNDAELFHFSYQRFIENRLRDTFGFRGTPLKLIIRERGGDQEKV